VAVIFGVNGDEKVFGGIWEIGEQDFKEWRSGRMRQGFEDYDIDFKTLVDNQTDVFPDEASHDSRPTVGGLFERYLLLNKQKFVTKRRKDEKTISGWKFALDIGEPEGDGSKRVSQVLISSFPTGR